MRNFLYVLAVLLPFYSTAQPGHYFLSHFAPADKNVDHVAFDMVQDESGLLFFATRAGILQFDGRNWDLIRGDGAVYAIEVDTAGNIYWGGAQGFGLLVRGPDGRMEMDTRSDSGVADIFQISAAKTKVYFLNDQTLYMYENAGRIQTIRANEKSGAFTALVEIFGIPYVSTERSELYMLQNNNELSPVVFGTNINDILFSSRHGNNYLIGTSENKLFTCGEDLVMKEIVLKETEYLDAKVVVRGEWVTDRLLAIATLRGGIVFLDPVTASVKALINYDTGLPDNEIYSLHVDKSRNVWASHNYGLTRIAPFLPFRSYSDYDGLQGNLLCAQTFNNDVYVGTSLGLFKLVKEEVYEEISYYVDGPVVSERSSAKAKTGKDGITRQSKWWGLFRFLKKDRDKTGSTERLADSKKEKRVRKILRSEYYSYKPVKGISAKVSGLVLAEGKLLASGLGGIFEIDDLAATPILEEPVRLAFATKDNHLVVPMYNEKVMLLTRDKRGWRQSDVLNNPEDYVSQIFEGSNGELWLCGTDRVFEAGIADGKFSGWQVIPIDNPNFSNVAGFVWNDKITFANANGFYRFDSQSGSMYKVDSLAVPKVYFPSPGSLYYADAHAWRVLGSDDIHRTINALSLLDDVRGISPIGRSGSLWVIEGNNKLYKFSGEEVLRPGAPYPLLLHAVTQGNRHIKGLHRVVVDQEGGPVTFNVVQPNYFGPSEYRYFLTGISDNWSDWSVLNNQITFPFLPPGNYSLQVQSRDIFGALHEMRSIPLHVRPIFWKSSWFYAMELAIFGLLGLLSLKLSVRYRMVSRLLALLSIILLIEFIQTLAGYSFSTSSPVADFLLQVAVAFMILPVEGYLRKVMFRSGHKSRLLAVIEELNRREKGEK